MYFSKLSVYFLYNSNAQWFVHKYLNVPTGHKQMYKGLNVQSYYQNIKFRIKPIFTDWTNNIKFGKPHIDKPW